MRSKSRRKLAFHPNGPWKQTLDSTHHLPGRFQALKGSDSVQGDAVSSGVLVVIPESRPQVTGPRGLKTTLSLSSTPSRGLAREG